MAQKEFQKKKKERNRIPGKKKTLFCTVSPVVPRPRQAAHREQPQHTDINMLYPGIYILQFTLTM